MAVIHQQQYNDVDTARKNEGWGPPSWTMSSRLLGRVRGDRDA